MQVVAMQVDVEEVLVRSVNGFVNAKNPRGNSQHIIYTYSAT